MYGVSFMSKVYSLCVFIHTTTVYYIPRHIYNYTYTRDCIIYSMVYIIIIVLDSGLSQTIFLRNREEMRTKCCGECVESMGVSSRCLSRGGCG